MRVLLATMMVCAAAAWGQEGQRAVRVKLMGEKTLKGVLEREDPDALRLRIVGQGRITVPRRRVVRVEEIARRDLDAAPPPEDGARPKRVAPGAPLPDVPRP